MTSEVTVTTQYIRGITRATGVSLDNHCAIANLLQNKNSFDGRVPLAVVGRVWEHLVEQKYDDEIFGLRAGLNVQISDLDIVGFLLSSCKTLQHAIQDLVHYNPIINEGTQFHLTHTNNECSLIYIPHYERCRQQRVEAAIAISIKIAKWLTNGSFEPLYVSFTHSSPNDPFVREAQKLLSCEIKYNQRNDALYFDQRLLSLPINQSNEHVYSLMLTLANNAMSRLPSNGFSSLVSKLIRQHPAFDKNEISGMLSISSRHLCRKLTKEGTSFRAIQSNVRYQLAKEWLIDNVHIQDIVDRFSFFDERSFSKAFKRWSGVTPNQFRTHMNPKDG